MLSVIDCQQKQWQWLILSICRTSLHCPLNLWCWLFFSSSMRAIQTCLKMMTRGVFMKICRIWEPSYLGWGDTISLFWMLDGSLSWRQNQLKITIICGFLKSISPCGYATQSIKLTINYTVNINIIRRCGIFLIYKTFSFALQKIMLICQDLLSKKTC